MNDIIALNQHQVKNIEHIFEGAEDTLIYSCLDGQMGQAWADQVEEPTCAMIMLGDFVFYSGDYTSEKAKKLVEYIPKTYESSYLYAIPDDEGWVPLIEEVYKDRYVVFERYATVKDAHAFDREQLKDYMKQLPSEYTIKPFDKGLYHEAMANDWSMDFVSNFISAEDFLKRGIGFGILYEGNLVCGASSYTVYNGGIEIEIGTKKEHRRKGLAIACASALILACLEQHRYPSWDAAHKGSLKLAEKLGYSFKEAYNAYGIKLSKDL